MTINDEILALANQIANNGQKPTLALIKAKLSQSVPLPVIINALKSWQHDPSFTTPAQKESANHEELPNSDASEADSLRLMLNEEFKQMKLEIAELKQLITTLMNQQKK